MERDWKGVVERKLQEKLQKGMLSAQSAISRLTAEGKIARDFMFETGVAHQGVEPNMRFVPAATVGRFDADLRMPDGVNNFKFHPHAVRQMAEKLGIPFSYLGELLSSQDEWKRLLALRILNTHNGFLERSPILVRAIGNEVRGVMSSNYRRLNSELIFNAHIEEIYNNGGQLSDGYMDDTRIMVESILPEPVEVRTPKNGSIWLAFGERFTTSDYGDGAQVLSAFILQGVCLNGMVRENALRTVHLGAKLGLDLGLSQRTYELDSETTASAIRDLTRKFYSSELIRDRMLEIKAASDIEVDPMTQLKEMFSLGKLLKGEMDNIGQLLMRGNPMDGIQGESTLWKLSQGITAFANNDKVEPRRRFELQKLAGDLFENLKN